MGDSPSRAPRLRLAVVEAERDQIGADIAEVVPPAVELHPNAANAYRDKIRDLKNALPMQTRTAACQRTRPFGRSSRRSLFIHRVGTSP